MYTDDRRQHMLTDVDQLEHNLCDAVDCSNFHIVVVGSIINGNNKNQDVVSLSIYYSRKYLQIKTL
jgi:hypothetical protein